jgi:hypothetical protein
MSESFVGWFAADDLSPLEQAQVAERRADQLEARQEERAQAERQAQREDYLEAMTFGERKAGNPLAELSRARQVLTAADDEYRDAEAVFRKAEAKRARAQENVEFFARRAAQVQEAVSRSAPAGDPLDQAQRAAHRAFVDATRSQMRDAALGRAPKARRPFASGLAVRSEPVTCPQCAELGATPEQSFMIHHMDADGNVLASEAEQSRYAAPGREITRGCDMDGTVTWG